MTYSLIVFIIARDQSQIFQGANVIINAKELIEFSFRLIDIQIKKYKQLATAGVGPDAKISAALIQAQVGKLLTHLNHVLSLDEVDDKELLAFAQNLKFYLNCEYLRGRAGWLLDDNKIHNTVYERVSSQLEELKGICSNEPLPDINEALLSPFQKQYLQDSHEIAFLILDLATKLKENPNRKDFGSNYNLGHGLKIMQTHAAPNGRYHNPEIGNEIKQKYELSKDFLENSPLQKSTRQLDKDTAREYEKKDKKEFKQLLEQFLQKYPESKLAKEDFKWFNVATLDKTNKANSSKALRNWGIFTIGVITTGIAATWAMQNMCAQEESSQNSWWPGL
ncbi:hypothetical protein E3983_00090 [Legionella israelensis]|uniref:Type IV secretion protein Dot n=1 Tax=Legionella israelensis TaxID=454 RepID=A0AAX1ECV9_9GAMM|nr:hypothetical protein [Legionella israelensis]QBR82897.1 hypothetical protein E3983_00090 [Legionella israelensis]